MDISRDIVTKDSSVTPSQKHKSKNLELLKLRLQAQMFHQQKDNTISILTAYLGRTFHGKKA